VKNQAPLVWAVIAILLIGLGLSALAGCNVGDIVKSRIPVAVQKSEGLPSQLSHNESQVEYEKWLHDVESDSQQWRANLERSEQIAGLLGNLTLSALDSVGPVIAGIPVGGALLPVLTGLAALFVKRPGDVSTAKLSQEKQDSYNAGIKRAASLAGQGVSAASILESIAKAIPASAQTSTARASTDANTNQA
jgi:hypothetical protein